MEYHVTVTKKNIKNIILKVKNTQEVLLSVPKNTSDKFIKEFLKEKNQWIIKSLKKFSDLPLNLVDKSYKNGDNIEYLGKKYILQIFSESKNLVEIDNNNFNVYFKGEYSHEKIQLILDKWYKKQAEILFKKYLNIYSQLIEEPFSIFKIRKMKTKWGSCRPTTRVITLNLELIKKPILAIEYVIFHEMAHLKYPHHKKEFWDFISIYMNDWKYRKELLLHV